MYQQVSCVFILWCLFLMMIELWIKGTVHLKVKVQPSSPPQNFSGASEQNRAAAFCVSTGAMICKHVIFTHFSPLRANSFSFAATVKIAALKSVKIISCQVDLGSWCFPDT